MFKEGAHNLSDFRPSQWRRKITTANGHCAQCGNRLRKGETYGNLSALGEEEKVCAGCTAVMEYYDTDSIEDGAEHEGDSLR